MIFLGQAQYSFQITATLESQIHKWFQQKKRAKVSSTSSGEYDSTVLNPATKLIRKNSQGLRETFFFSTSLLIK